MTDLTVRDGTVERGRPTVLLSSVSSDAHTWNLVFLQLLLEDMGHDVVNLGPCVPDDLLVAACRRHRPDVVVISTVNGHGHIDGPRVVRRLRAEAVPPEVPVLIGGKLTVGRGGAGRVAALLAAGFDGVYEDDDGVAEFCGYLEGLRRPALEGGPG
ncbi:cobalamin B12-binding domain-containing protein [Actinomadura roseirufa]|uniref:cobalamin B12-binding domain-containing protein n=1 Tax=Actinomadura roseirufa TaxID=2094049 RepID=UPI0010419DEE|nr:cobalamin-dependent protein [Actinomadura roseirufa]